MASSIMSVGLLGMKGHKVRIEANVRADKEQCVIIGLPDASIKESKERVLSCLHMLNLDIEMKKITIHLSPADVKKSGTGFDCAMLLAVMQEVLKKPLSIDESTCVLAGLSLNGELMQFHGMIPAIQQAMALGFKRILLPPIDVSFLRKVGDVELVPLPTMDALVSYLQGQPSLLLYQPLELLLEEHTSSTPFQSSTDISSIRGHNKAKRAMEISAAGGHHILLSGPPGCGKTMLADAFHTILPDLTHEDMLELYGIYHLARETRGFSSRPPYRNPHHSASSISLIGGGTFPKPGEISLAHNGVLFLDELGEFSRKTLDMLRQPLERGEVTISRVKQTVTYPSTIILIAATNPCPCGYFGSNERYCVCTPKQVVNYQLKASGPLLDRLDFILTLKNVGLQQEYSSETSAKIKERTTRARDMQRIRYGTGKLNGSVAFQQLHETCALSDKQSDLIDKICFEQKWSNRTQAKLIRIARTIADLEGHDVITDSALQKQSPGSVSLLCRNKRAQRREVFEMPRRKRNWHPNAYFHVIMRGNNRQNIFRTEEDILQLLRVFEYAAEKLHFKMIAFCIMTNHYHLLIRSEHVDLAKVMAHINRRYSDYYAKRYSHIGRIYEKRYFSKEADGPQAILAISGYIHRNPIDTQVPMVVHLKDYPYSSFPYYVNNHRTKPTFLQTDIVANFLPHPFDKTNQAYCIYCLTYKQDVEDDT